MTRPAVLLLDEPFSALDAFTRFVCRIISSRSGAIDRPTMLFVTHDIDEALVLADRVVVMRGQPGRIRRTSASTCRVRAAAPSPRLAALAASGCSMT